MHYSLGLATSRIWPTVSIVGALGQDEAQHDPCMVEVIDRLERLSKRKRRAVRIVDINCGDGALLIHAAREARKLGFLSIECLGVDQNHALIEDAQERVHFVRDTAIGLDFAIAAPLDQLRREAEFPADIILYAAQPLWPPAMMQALRRAGDVAIRHNSPSGKDHA